MLILVALGTVAATTTSRKLPKASLESNPFLITTQAKRNLSNLSGIGGVLSAT